MTSAGGRADKVSVTVESAIRVVLLDGATRSSHYDALRRAPRLKIETASYPPVVSAITADIALLSDEHDFILANCIAPLRDRGIPTVHIVDGIVEWRNVWSHPRSNTSEGRPLFQPILADKICCLGLWQALLLESFGNHPGCCEITGVPRLDYLGAVRRKPGPFVLVATAKTPGFTAHDTTAAIESMKVVARWFSDHSSSWSPKWRVAKCVSEAVLGEDPPDRAAKESLAAILERAAAVITTPSTLALEAMSLGIPTLIIDFTNSPAYVHSAWSATSATTFEREIESLLAMDSLEHQRRLGFQRFLATLQCEPGDASPRVVHLIEAMVSANLEGRALREPMLPRRSVYSEGYTGKSMRTLYPMIPAFDAEDVPTLQARICHLEAALRAAHADLELSRKHRRRGVVEWIRGGMVGLRRNASNLRRKS